MASTNYDSLKMPSGGAQPLFKLLEFLRILDKSEAITKDCKVLYNTQDIQSRG